MIDFILGVITAVILTVLLILLLGLMALAIISKYSKNKWFCTAMGWHFEPDKKASDGCSMYGNCPRCGKRVMLDSQGNWF